MEIDLRSLRAPNFPAVLAVDTPLPAIPDAETAFAAMRDVSPFVGRQFARYVEQRSAANAQAAAILADLFEPCSEADAARRIDAAATAFDRARGAWNALTAMASAQVVLKQEGKS